MKRCPGHGHFQILLNEKLDDVKSWISNWVQGTIYGICPCYVHKVITGAVTVENPQRKGGCHQHTGVQKPFD